MARKALRYGTRTLAGVAFVTVFAVGFYAFTQKVFVFDAAHRINQASIGHMG